MARRICLFLPLAWLFFPLLLLGQQTELGNIFGQLRVVRGDFPSHQIMVELRYRGATISSMYADTGGKFGFDNLVGGEYHIIINDEAYEPVDERVILHPEPVGNAMAFITLRPRLNASPAEQLPPRASGSNPYLVDPADYNKRFPKKAVKEYERGLEAERKGRPDEAADHYLGALKTAPDYYPAHNNLGSLYLSKSDFKSAEEQFREAVRLDQNEAQPYFNLANVLLLTGRYPESESAVASGLQRRPDSGFGNFLQGCLLGRAGHYPEAEKSLQQALRLDPSLWQARLQLVNLYVQQRRRDDAVSQLQTFLRLFPSVSAAAKAKDLLNRLQTETQAAQPAK
jgi:tetratricopeptide (TPR) repeat protein